MTSGSCSPRFLRIDRGERQNPRDAKAPPQDLERRRVTFRGMMQIQRLIAGLAFEDYSLVIEVTAMIFLPSRSSTLPVTVALAVPLHWWAPVLTLPPSSR